MMVEGHLVLHAANQFETVVRAIPIDGWTKPQPTLSLTLQGCIKLGRLLILLVIFGTVEGVRAKAFYAQSCMPVQLNLLTIVASLIENLATLVVAVQMSNLRTAISIATGIVRRKAMVCNTHAPRCRQIAKRPAFHSCRTFPFLISPFSFLISSCHDVNRSD